MFGVWLNRLGIILNFIAGFMLAPELIGLHRIERAESYLERKLSMLLEKLVAQAGWGRATDKDLIFLFQITVGFLTVFCNLLFVAYCIRVGPPYVRFSSPASLLIVSAVSAINACFFLAAPFLYIAPFAGFIVSRLEGNKALQSALVWWGVVFFIAGNLFQLISTFVPTG